MNKAKYEHTHTYATDLKETTPSDQTNNVQQQHVHDHDYSRHLILSDFNRENLFNWSFQQLFRILLLATWREREREREKEKAKHSIAWIKQKGKEEKDWSYQEFDSIQMKNRFSRNSFISIFSNVFLLFNHDNHDDNNRKTRFGRNENWLLRIKCDWKRWTNRLFSKIT